ncbi:MAG: formamidopyrimidine-DNA glycosylase [Litorilinea sp.]|nr:MAG: formamidopyrimidine-DNA glycosylase [Litorilinea sp.]
MPELPEVETYLRELEPTLTGRRVTAVQVFWPRTIATPSVDAFCQGMGGQVFAHFGRRGKFMLLGLAGGDTLIVHLRMTGRLHLEPASTGPSPHTHVVMALDDGRALHYTDTRKFGRLWLVSDPETVLGHLGPEPLDTDFTAAYLAGRLAGRRASIKALLLDQGVVAGVGNIYADEALFLAGIHPARPAGSLAPAEVERLCGAVTSVLQQAIERQGSSLGDSPWQNYRRPNGQPGSFQDEHKVFQRTGQPCVRCGQPIQRMVIAQRGTHFCPHCQPLAGHPG